MHLTVSFPPRALAGKVYDVTPFMDDHPGGGEIMLSAAGKDGTQDFEDVGHSPHARDCLLYTSPSPRDKRQSRMPSSA